MHKRLKVISLVSILIIIIPFIGVPFVWRQWGVFVFGVIVLILTLLSLKDTPSDEQSEKTFIENGDNADI